MYGAKPKLRKQEDTNIVFIDVSKLGVFISLAITRTEETKHQTGIIQIVASAAETKPSQVTCTG